MNHEIDNIKQKARLALIMKTSKLRLWFYTPLLLPVGGR